MPSPLPATGKSQSAAEDAVAGFDAAYDVDEGSIRLALDGSWDASKTLNYNAKGLIHVDGRKAHYDDYAIARCASTCRSQWPETH